MPNPRRQDERLQAIYDRLPSIECKGACHGACCFIEASQRERERMERASGQKLDTVDAADPAVNPLGLPQIGRDNRPLARFRCTMLGDDGRCTVYDLRPMICRMYGVVEGLECYRGCKPERTIPAPEAMILLAEAMEVGGKPPEGYPSVAALRAAAEDPERCEELREWLKQQQRGLDTQLARRGLDARPLARRY